MERKLTNPFDYVKAINTNDNIMWGYENYSLIERDYKAFLTNRAFSYHNDTVLYANEMNQRHHLDNKLQFEYLLNNIRPRKRFAKWIKRESPEDVSVIKQYYGYNNTKAIEALSVLSEKEIKILRDKVQKGGKDGDKHTGDD